MFQNQTNQANFIPFEELENLNSDQIKPWNFSQILKDSDFFQAEKIKEAKKDLENQNNQKAENENFKEIEEFEEKIKQIKTEFFEKGFLAGSEQSQKETEEIWQERLEEYKLKIGQVQAEKLNEILEKAKLNLQNQWQKVSEDLLNLACDIAKQVIRQELKQDKKALLPVIREALFMLGNENIPTKIKLNPQDFSFLQNHLENLQNEKNKNSNFKFIVDENIKSGDCFIETQESVIDASLEKRWQRAVATLGLVYSWN